MTPDAPVLERSLLRDVDAALDPLRRKQRDLQAFMASQLERLELLAAQVETREKELAEQSEALGKERGALDEEWSHLDQLVETAQAHAAEIRQEKQRLEALVRANEESGRQEELRRLQDEAEQARRERTILEEELAAAQRKIGQLADVSVELAEARSELRSLRRMMTPQRAEVPPAHEAAIPAHDGSAAAANDFALDDVLTQFEAVKRGLARHRTPRK